MKHEVITKKSWPLMISMLLLGLIFSFSAQAQYPAGSPVAINGKLSISGGQMVNECGNAVQLRGMSSHGPQWFENCYNTSSLDALVNDWGIDIFRIAMYVEEGGYVNNPDYWKTWIDNKVDECAERGIYCMIDWHILNPGDPWANIDAAREFWTYMSAKHNGKEHVLYEIANEPNGVQWPRVKSYAEDIIPRIRANDPNTIVIVGTPTWSQDVDIAAEDPLNFSNIMYALHFYSGTHTDWLRNKANQALAAGLALYVTEFGTSQASGDGGPYLEETQRWMDWMATNKISWINWSFADKAEVSAALNSGACSSGNWNSTSQSGTFIKDHILVPADNFVCDNGGTTYTITATAGSGGTISPQGNVQVTEGGNQSFTITPSSGYQIENVTVDGSSAGAIGSYTFTNVTANHSIAASFSQVSSTQQAYPNGVPHAIPGAIEAVNFDTGGEGVAYHDTSTGNAGPGPRQNENVDIENRTSAGNVGWIATGEWLEYSVNVSESGTYDIDVQVASSPGGGAYHIQFDGADKTGVKSVGATGGWGSFITQKITGVSLDAGTQIMRVYMNSGSFNLGSIQFSLSGDDGNNDCNFGAPGTTALPGINKSYNHIHVLGTDGPNLSNVTTFTINWDLQNKGLWQFSMNTNNGNPNWYVDLLGKLTHNFAGTQPEVTLSNSGFAGLDGSYHVNLDGENFVMVSQTGNFTLYFSNSSTAPNCTSAKSMAREVSKAINEPLGSGEITIYPNPFNNEIEISLTAPEKVEGILIYNQLGVLVEKIEKDAVQQQNSIRTTKAIPSGLYLIKINTSSETKIFRVMKE